MNKENDAIGLIRILAWDQFLYFLVLLLLGITTELLVEIDVDLGIFIFFSAVNSPALPSIVASRLLISMKEADEKSLTQGIDCGSRRSASGIDFAEGACDIASVLQGNIVEPNVPEVEEVV